MVTNNATNAIGAEAFELHADCLVSDTKVKRVNFKLIIVYFKSNDSNEKQSQLINNLLEKEQEQPITINGDFNVHTGLLGDN